MKKVAVFGNAGGGKSTLSQQLSTIAGLPLYALDKIQHQPGGIKVPESEYQQIHQQILATDSWIIDGFGSIETLWVRLDEADSLVFIDLPLPVHFWWVTKRLLTGYFNPPAGWPEKTPIFQSSLSSYRVLWLCHQRLTPKYREYIERVRGTKTVYHLRAIAQISQFLKSLESKTPSSL
ncbi:adenylate kinase [Oscillatoria sp. FACHB-1406]|uniref:adenylate kinase n=1 Tax=Oscillatoria sp. FACHB-1406 TaxID=2692846 RepID=UPI0016835963|nr:adenylate kinase [Oscillatoria sp. FACHB-1406]MBD2576236.1 adenylate kinase [Oscillatoria sp. FACHB-1406]